MFPSAIDLMLDECRDIYPQEISTRREVWQIVQSQKNGQSLEMAIFGAYLDQRFSDQHFAAQLILFTVSNAAKRQEVWCHIWYNNRKAPHIAPAQLNMHFYQLKRWHNQSFHQYTYTCKVQYAHTQPVNVSLVFEKCQQSTSLLPIIVPTSESKYEFGACVAPTFSTLSTSALIEWIELNNILGIEEFNIYESDLNQDAVAVLQHYASTGLVRLHHVLPPIFDLDNCDGSCHKTSTTATINDCLYRNMHRYKYIVIIDLDEFIIPHKNDILNLHDMMALITQHRGPQHEPAIQYSFMNMLYLLEFSPKNSKMDRDLITTRYLTRLKPIKDAYKSIINPIFCRVAANHICQITIPEEAKGTTRNEYIPSGIAVLHHYRKCKEGLVDCKKAMNEGVYDDLMLKYRDELRKNVDKTLESIEL